MGAKLKEIIRINKAKYLPIKVFFHIHPDCKRASKDEYCGQARLYFHYRPNLSTPEPFGKPGLIGSQLYFFLENTGKVKSLSNII